jgi:hypothetical protein
MPVECGNTGAFHLELRIVDQPSPGGRVEYLDTGPLRDWRGLRPGQRITITTTRGEVCELRRHLRAIFSVVFARSRTNSAAVFELIARIDHEPATGEARGRDTADVLHALAERLFAGSTPEREQLPLGSPPGRQATTSSARWHVDQGYDSRAIRAEEFGSAGENSTQGGAG